MSTIAVFIALGGGAYAITSIDRNSVRSRHIAPGQVKRSDLGRSAVNSAKIQDGAVQPNDVNLTALRQRIGGATGPQGVAGPQGVQGPQGPPGADATIGPGSIGPGQLGGIPSARVFVESDTEIGPGQETLSFTEDYDNGGLFDPATPTEVGAPIAGVYDIVAFVWWEAQGAGDPGYRFLEVKRSDGETVLYDVQQGRDAADYREDVTQTAAGLVRLAAGDAVHVDIAAYFDPTAALDIFGSTDPGETALTMHWVGP